MKNTGIFKKILNYAVVIVGGLGAASLIGLFFRAMGLPETNAALVYLLAVLLSTLIIPGYVFGSTMSVLAAFCFNYLFTEPYFTFTSNAPSYIITFLIMTITAFVTSSIIAHAKINEQKFKQQEADTKALYTLTDRLTTAACMHKIAGIAAESINKVICKNAACICFDEKGNPEKEYVFFSAENKQALLPTGGSPRYFEKLKHLQTPVYKGEEFYDYPIHGREMLLGVIRLPADGAQNLTKQQNTLLNSMIESTALAMDRFRSVQQRILLREETVQERYRSNLLRAISHDLRTPLSGIMGTTEMLMSMTDRQDERHALITDINEDAAWLYSLVENILNLTRLQDGKLAINKQLEAVEEVLGQAISHILRRYPKYDIAVTAPPELFLVPMDAKLITQVIVNLLDNAVKHTPHTEEIRIDVFEDKLNKHAVFCVKDCGCGIEDADFPHIFQTFYTSKTRSSDAQLGIGLGLAICETIVKAHGGTICAKNRPQKGSEFIFTLPLKGESNEPM